MRSPPPEVVATWPRPNYINPEARRPDLVVVGLLSLTAALLCLGLRLYIRLRITRQTGLDDWVMVAATVFSTAVTISIVLAFDRFGWKHHVWDLRPATLVAGRKASFTSQVFFIGSTLLTKVSILLSYLRLAPLNSLFRRLSFVGSCVVAVSTVIFWILLFTECRPVASYWNLANTARDCVDEMPLLLSHAVATVVFDCFVWVLPLPTIYRANLPLNQRLALIALFSVGLFVVIAAGVRIHYFVFVLGHRYDVTWEGSSLWMWTAVEGNLGIICACVPWIKSLVKLWRGKRAGTTGGSGSAGNRPHPEVPTVGSGGPSAFRMGKGSRGETDTAKYIELESCSRVSETETRPG